MEQSLLKVLSCQKKKSHTETVSEAFQVQETFELMEEGLRRHDKAEICCNQCRAALMSQRISRSVENKK